jgi:predicted metallopeptidase
MAIRYDHAPDVERRIHLIAEKLGMRHIQLSRLKIFRSRGSKSRAIARCHALPKIMQSAIGVDAYYAIEVLSEKFDRMGEEEQTKVLIHELLHIPKSFGGGFRQHDYVCSKNINAFYKRLQANLNLRREMGE